MLAPIICSGRSGTTLLSDLLMSHPKITGFREFFGTERAQFKHIKDPDEIRALMLRQFKDHNKPRMYFTTTYFHRHRIDKVDAYMREDKAKVILLLRNVVDTVLSICLVEEQKKIAGITHDERFRKPYKLDKVELPFGLLHECLCLHVSDLQIVPERFRGLEIHEVHYEDLVNNQQEECDKLLDFLKFERQELFLEIERPNPLVKQRTLPRQEAILNWDILCEKYKRTVHKKYFVEE